MVAAAVPLGIYAASASPARRRLPPAIVLSQVGISIPQLLGGAAPILVLLGHAGMDAPWRLRSWSGGSGPDRRCAPCCCRPSRWALFPAPCCAPATRSPCLDPAFARRTTCGTRARQGPQAERRRGRQPRFRNALLPIVTRGGHPARQLVAGASRAESVSRCPGSSASRWAPSARSTCRWVQGVRALRAPASSVINFVVDLAYGALDPRILYRIDGARRRPLRARTFTLGLGHHSRLVAVAALMSSSTRRPIRPRHVLSPAAARPPRATSVRHRRSSGATSSRA